ncbi:hypothetical protein CASFOL_006807 [Castilleja foliolosa]|uniref:F-box domain-containing protein n=1 Tax=Castilleja foliolosa TaxID=1961234 RepID=A0ABD3EBI2_9LAMI
MESPSAEPENTSAAQTVASIDDLFRKILIHLPLKLLSRLRLVSKRFASFIVTLDFNRASGLVFQHDIDVFPSDSCLSVVEPWHEFVPFFPYEDEDEDEDDEGEYYDDWPNGLFLCRSNRASTNRRKYYVYNATSKKYSILPVGGEIDLKTVCGMCLAFDITKSPYYKVVCVCALSSGSESKSEDSRFRIEVYSSETGAWRNYEESFTSNVNFEYGVYWNGAIHWIWFSRYNQPIYFDPEIDWFSRDNQPIYFNPDIDRTPKVMPALPALDGDNSTRNCYFGESCGHLHYIDVYKTVTQFNVYEMKKDYSEWFVKYKVDLSNIGISNLFCILAAIRGCDLNDDDHPFLVFKLRGKVIRYDLNDGTCEIICGFKSWESDKCSSSICPTNIPLQYIDCLCQV